jgi:hypothetical protein
MPMERKGTMSAASHVYRKPQFKEPFDPGSYLCYMMFVSINMPTLRLSNKPYYHLISGSPNKKEAIII